MHYNSPSRFTGRGWGMGPDLPMQNYEDIGEDSVEAQNYLYQVRRKHEISIEKMRAKRAG